MARQTFYDPLQYSYTPGYSLDNLEAQGLYAAPQEDEGMGFFDRVGDAVMGIPRGLEGLVQGLYGFADFVTGDDLLPDYDKKLTGESRTFLGSLVEGVSTFAIPGGIAARAFGATAKGIGFASRFTRFAAAGAVADFVVGNPNGGRLADLAQEHGLGNDFVDWLATDPDDNELTARMKNTLEGAVVGGVFDGLFEIFKGSRAYLKTSRNGGSVEAAENAAIDAVDGIKVEGVPAEWFRNEFGYDHNEALVVSRMAKQLGIDPNKVAFGHQLDEEGRLIAREATEADPASRGATGFLEDGRAIIVGLANPDVSTGIHEISHVARRQVLSGSMEVKARKWAGATDGWNEAAEERFALGFEQYVKEGKAPTKELEPFFQDAAKMVRAVYADLSSNGLAVDLSDDMRKVFDNLLTRKDLPLWEKSGDGFKSNVPRPLLPDRYGQIPRGRAILPDDAAIDAALSPKLRHLARANRNIPEGRNVIVGAYKEGSAKLSNGGKFPLQVVRSKSGTLGVDTVVTVRNATFSVDEKARQALLAGDKTKAPIAGVKGKIHHPETPSFDGIPVSFNPKRNHLFVTESGMAVRHADEVTIVGNQAYARGNVSYWDKSAAPKASDSHTRFWRGAKLESVLRQSHPEGPKVDVDPRFDKRRIDKNLPKEPLTNYDRINTESDLNRAFAHLGERSYKAGFKRPDNSHYTLQQIYEEGMEAQVALQEMMPSATFDMENLIVRVRGDAEAIKEISERTIAYKAELAQVQEYAINNIREFVQKEGWESDSVGLAQALRRYEILHNYAAEVRRVQGEMGAALGAQRIRINTDDFKRRAYSFPAADKIDAVSAVDIVAKHGGKKKVARFLRQVEAIDAANPGRIVPRRFTRFAMVPEYFIANILSGTITHSVNFTSGVITNVLHPLEQAVGHLFTDRAAFKRDMSQFASLFGEISDSAKIAWHSLRDDSEKIASGTGSMFSDGGRTNATRAISSAAQGVDPTSGIGKTLDAIGKFVNIPSRMMMVGDQFHKALAFRTRLRRLLWDSQGELSEGFLQSDPKASARFIERQLQIQGLDGQYLTQEAMLKRVAKLADEKGLQGDARHAFIQDAQISDETSGVIAARVQESLDAAREVTFTTDLRRKRGKHGLGRLVSSKINGTTLDDAPFSMRDQLGQLSGHVASMTNSMPGLKLMFPFIRTPVNLLQWSLDRSLGAASDGMAYILSKEVKLSLGPDGKADLLGRMATGSALATMAWLHASSPDEDTGIPKLTGSGPRDYNTRRAWEATGWRPYSIRLGDKWIQYNRLDPVASALGLFADIAQEPAVAANLGEETNYIGALGVAVSHSLMDKTYLKGLSTIVAAFDSKDSRGWEKLGQSLVQGFMPASSLVGQAINPVFKGDRVVRDIRSVFDAARAKFILSDPKKLPARRNALGEVTERDSGLLFGKSDPISPIRTTAVRRDAVSRELVGTGIGLGSASSLRDGVDYKEFTNDKGVSAYDFFQEQIGTTKIGGRSLRQTLAELVRAPGYQRLARVGSDDLDSPRAAIMRRIISRYRRKASAETRRSHGDLNSAIQDRRYRAAMQAMGQQ